MSDMENGSSGTVVPTPTTGHGGIGEDVREAARNAVRDAVRAAEAEGSGEDPPAALESAQDESEGAEPVEASGDAESASEGDVDAAEAPKKADKASAPETEFDRLSRERAKAKAIQKDAKAQADGVISEARAELEKAKAFLAEVSAERDSLRSAKESLAQEYEKLRKAALTLKRDPLKALRELQVDPEDMLTRIAKTGTEEMRTISELDELREALEEERAWRKRFENQEAEARKAQETAQQNFIRSQQETIVQNYITEASKLDKYPNLNALYGDDHAYLVSLGHREADELRSKDQRADISPEKLLASIEAKAAKRRGASVSPQKGEAKGLPGTLTKSDKTDRYSTLSVPDDLEERRRLAREQVKALVRQGEIDGDI